MQDNLIESTPVLLYNTQSPYVKTIIVNGVINITEIPVRKKLEMR